MAISIQLDPEIEQRLERLAVLDDPRSTGIPF